MSSHFGVNETVALLQRLRDTVADFAAREQTIRKELASALAAEKFRRDKAIEQIKTRYGTARSETEARLAEAASATERRYEQRRDRLAPALRSSKKLAALRVEDAEGRRKHRLQTETLQAQRRHESETLQTETNFAEFRRTLSGEHDAIALLEERARKAFGGFGKFQRHLAQPATGADASSAQDEYTLIAELRSALHEAETDLANYQRRFLPKFFKLRWLWLFLALGVFALVPTFQHFQIADFSYTAAGIVFGALVVTGVALHQITASRNEPLASRIAGNLAKARFLDELCYGKSDARRARELERIEVELKQRQESISRNWSQTVEEAERLQSLRPGEIEAKEARVRRKLEAAHQVRSEDLSKAGRTELENLDRSEAAELGDVRKATAEKDASLEAKFEQSLAILEREWNESICPIYERVRALQGKGAELSPDNDDFWRDWTAPAQFAHLAKFADMNVEVAALAGAIPKDARLTLPGPAQFSVPMLLSYPTEGSLLIETPDSGRQEAIDAINHAVLRLLSVAAPGRLSFTVVDPIGLGQNFSATMHLADYAEHLINSHIWTQPAQIEEKLADLNEHMEKVIQMYLRSDYATIAEYNEQAGNIAEKYHFLVIADFPANFSETALRRLEHIAASGARCGVYLLIHWNQKIQSPPGFHAEPLRQSCIHVVGKNGRFHLEERNFPGTSLRLSKPPEPELATSFIHRVGQTNRDSNRVEVPFSHVTPPDEKIWSEETTSELRVPIGRTGATKLQYLTLGKGTRQHALLAGKTGSGKSTLFHVIVTNLALWCSPDEVEFYLIDFKKGVEFKCYADKKLPHARVVAIESDREFGLSVLQRVDEELKRRGDLFRKKGVQDLGGYKRSGGLEPMPRSLLMIDEFQEFFVEDDKVSQSASVLLDRIVRQGRAFGIHVILGSQTLGGAYTMARTTIGQMVVRIALQCNEADAYLIMDDNNPAPRLLSRPGEGIYNDEAGNALGNSPFQAVWLPDDVRDKALERVSAKAESTGKHFPAPVVFEGDAPADVRENAELRRVIPNADGIAAPVRIWLGAPNSIKGPTEAVFKRQSGNHLLIVGQNEEAILSLLTVAVVALAAQAPRTRVYFIDASPPGSAARDHFDRLFSTLPESFKLVRGGELPEIFTELAGELKNRGEDASGSATESVFVCVHGLQKFAKLRYEEDFSFSSDADAPATPSTQLNQLLSQGASQGMHVIATCDSYNNVNRFLSKKAFSEFEMRVLFQMSANDSASLIDSPKAGTLGLNRALFYNEQEGYLELFRPYALPPFDWIEGMKRARETSS